MADGTEGGEGDDLVLQEFVVETTENLEQADQCLLDLERTPNDLEPVRYVFRAVHTLKSSCGWLGFRQLEQLAHAAESLLATIRSEERPVTPEIVEALLATVDLTRRQLEAITADGNESTLDGELDRWADRLRALAGGVSEPATGTPPEKTNSGVATPAGTPVAPAPDPGEPSTPEDLPSAPQLPNEAFNAAAPASVAADAAELSVRVDVKLLDELMKLVGELVLTRNQVGQFVDGTDSPPLIAAAQRLNVVTSDLQDRIMLTRMQPLSHIWGRFPRLIRDAAQSCGKKVRLQMEGADTELDRTMVEAMRDPLTHLVRNAVDHGIETPEQRIAAGKPPEAVVHLRAHHEEGQVHIEVEDDGRGIDVAAVRRRAVSSGLLSVADARALSDERAWGLIFAAGFSTRDEVTELSGRGVGMDVVKTDVEKVGGRVEIHSAAGAGTRVTLRLPLTLAILLSVLVECAGETYAIPQVNLLELVLLEGAGGRAAIREVGEGAPVYSLRGELLPILYLREILGYPPDSTTHDSATQSDDIFILVLHSGGRRFGLVVDSVLDTQEIVVKPLGRHFAATGAFSGATILGDGRLALILDVAGVALRGRIQTDATIRSAAPVGLAETDRAEAAPGAETSQVLLMSTRSGARLAVPLDKVRRLEEIPERDVEEIGGREVVQYRGGILRLLRVEDLLGERPATPPEEGNRDRSAAGSVGGLQVLVHSAGDREIGLVVHQVLDIVAESAGLQETRPRQGVLGSVVLAGRVTEVLDLEAAIAATSPAASAEVR